MATTTENIGLTLTPGSEWATKKYGTFITEMAGQTGSSNLELIDKAVGEDRAAISALEEAVDAIEANMGGVNTNVQEQLDSKADKTAVANSLSMLNNQITTKIAAIDFPVDSVNGKKGNVTITAEDLNVPSFAFSAVYGGLDTVVANQAQDHLWFEGGSGIEITGESTSTKKSITISGTDATTSASGLMSAADKSKVDYTNIAYGTCTTAAATAAKVITVSGNTNWSLTPGSRITVKFSATNTASNPTFNVNGTGAKSVWYNTALITTSSLSYAGYANRPMDFVYDGTQYIFIGWSIDSNTTYTNASLGQGYGTCSTSAATVAKVVTLSGYSLVVGGIVTIKFTYAVPAGATMNVNSNGAKPIYYRGVAIDVGIIDAGDTATFVYNGSQYHLLTVDRNRFFSLLVPYGTQIAANTNMNTLDLLKVGNYYCASNANAATLTNCPTDTAFMMTVSSPLSTIIDNETTGTWVYRLRTIQTYTGPAYEQYCYANATADSTNGTKGTWSYGQWNKIIKATDLKTAIDEAISGVTNTNLTANRVLISDGDGKVAASAVTSTELGYLDGVSGAIQTQLNGKAASTHNHAAGDITSGTLAVARGGTGVTANPSMLTNLGSTSAASVFAASPRPGVTGTLPIANGGTGATTAAAALSALGAFPNQLEHFSGSSYNDLTDGVWKVQASMPDGPNEHAAVVYHREWDANFETQLAFSANTNTYWRYKTGGTWQSWVQVFSHLGGTLIGNLFIERGGSPQIKLTNTATGRKMYILNSEATGGLYLYNRGETSSNQSTIRLNPETSTLADMLQLIVTTDGVQDTYQVHHSGNKPVGSYMGNGSATTRSINTDGVGNFCMIWRDGVVGCILVGPEGAIRSIDGGVATVEEITFADGKLTISSNSSHYNGSAKVYNYQVL